MQAPRHPRSDRAARRLGLVLWACCALLFQGFVLPAHAVAMATGIEVCSAAGPVRVDADGHRLDGSAAHQHGDGCCCIAHLAPPPPVAAPPLPPSAQPAPEVAVPRLARILAWLAPLSRGPPARG